MPNLAGSTNMPWKSKTHDPLKHQRKRIAAAKGREEYRYDRIGRLYHLPEWKDPVIGLRAQQLAKEPLCRECRGYGIRRAGTTADHVVPHKGIMSLFLDPDNLQTLCTPHHSMKTAKEKKR